MKIRSIALALAGATIAVSGCNRPDTEQTSARFPKDTSAVAIHEMPTGLSAPRAPQDLNPPAPNANAAAPGTDATVALANQPTLSDSPKTEGSNAQTAMLAQDAANQAGDTASADAAKKQVWDSTMLASNEPRMTGTARDTAANAPRHGTLTQGEESNQLPKAGQVNNHSSTALEKDSGR